MSARGIPLKFDNAATQRAEARALWRAAAALALGPRRSEMPLALAQRAFGGDERAAAVIKAAVSPHSTSDTANYLSITRTNPLLTIAPQSAAARLFEKVVRFDLAGIATITVPFPVTYPVPLFVAEGAPVPVAQGALGSSTVGPVRKLSFVVVISRELDEASPETASTVISRLMGSSAARSLDAVVFDANSADGTRPAGLLHGVTAIPGAASVGTTIGDLISQDISKLGQAFSDANIDFQNMILVTNVLSHLQYQITRGYAELPVPCIPSPSVPQGTVIAIAPEGVASAYSGVPEIEIVNQAAVHFESSTPLPIGTPGTPPTVAAPARQLWQEDLLGIKLRQRAAWAVLQPGAVQYINSATW
jgi:hypothetical protein